MRLSKLQSGVLLDLSENLEHWVVDEKWREHLARIEEVRNYQPKLPEAFAADLRPYQIEGYEWLSRLAFWGVGACLADDMGLGKTLMALALLVERSELGPALVVARSVFAEIG